MRIIHDELSVGLGIFATNLSLNVDNRSKVIVDRNGAIGGEIMIFGGNHRRGNWYTIRCQNITNLCCTNIVFREEIRHRSHQFQNELVVLLNRLMVLAIVDELTKDGVQ